MTAASPYKDLRSEFFRRYYEKALPYDDYLAKGPAHHAALWRDYESKVALDDAQRARIGTFARKMYVLVLSGVWCGDCMRQGPLLRLIETAGPHIEMRYIDNRENPELQDELRINGAEKVPVAVSLSEDFFELARFGDRHLSVYRRKMESELGVACDPGFGAPGSELAFELGEWIDHFDRLQAILRLSQMLRNRHGD